MKQFQTTYSGQEEFAAWLHTLHTYSLEHDLEGMTKLFYLSTDSVQETRLEPALAALRTVFPDAVYAGASGNGGICSGALVTGTITAAALFFEHPQSRAEVLQFPFSVRTQDEVAAALIEAVRIRPWVRAIEMFTTIGDVDLPKFCKDLSALPEEIQIFGGGALARDTHDGTSSDTYVFSSAGERSPYSGAFVLLGGSDLHVQSRYITGWRSLGLPFEVTDAEQNIVKTLDGQPAFEVYQKYLHVPEDPDHYFDMAVVFPFCFTTEEATYLRVSMMYFPDGSMAVASAVEPHTMANIAYGDPAYIMQSIRENVATVLDFSAQAIRLYSCASRQYYWGEDAVSRETLPFEELAPTSGFYTSGELLRTGKQLLLHNVTIVVAAYREGEPARTEQARSTAEEQFSRQIMINHCLTTFINASTERLIEANGKLRHMAATDGLTGLDNRRTIGRKIIRAVEAFSAQAEETEGGKTPGLLMIDLDNFKQVNDTYGHREGDEVLRHAARVFRDQVERCGIRADIGRWGGEEFMLLLHETDPEQEKTLADAIRTAYAAHRFAVSGQHTLSVGLTMARKEDDVDTLCNRVDMGLYRAKNAGKNQSVIV